MNLFDRVVVTQYITDPPDYSRIGQVGTIVKIDNERALSYTVAFAGGFTQPFCAAELMLAAPTKIFIWEIGSMPGVIMAAAESLHHARELLGERDSELIRNIITKEPTIVLEDGCGVYMLMEKF